MKIFSGFINRTANNSTQTANGKSYPNLKPLTQDTLQLQTKVKGDEQFNGLKQEIQAKLKENPEFIKYINIETLTKENILAAYKVLFDDKLSHNDNVMKSLQGILYNIENENDLKFTEKILNEEKLYNTPEFMRHLYFMLNGLTSKELNAKSNMMDKIVSDEKLYNSPEFMKNTADILTWTHEKKDFKVKSDLINKIVSDKRIYENSDFMGYMGKAAAKTQSFKENQIKSAVIDKILSDEKLYNNPGFMERAGVIVVSTEDPQALKAGLDVTDILLSDEKYYNNPNFMKYCAPMTISYSKTYEQAQLRLEMADKILSSEILYNNPDFMKYSGGIISSTKTQQQIQLRSEMADKILSSEILYNNPDFMKYSGEIVYLTRSPEHLQAKTRIIDEILNNENYINNKELMSCIGEIISRCDSLDDAELISEVLNKYLNDDEAGLTPWQILMVYVDGEENNISYEDVNNLNKAIGIENVSKLSEEDTVLAVKFVPLCKIENINEISLSGKRKLLRDLVASNADLFDMSDDIKKFFPLLPKNQEEYCALLPALVRSIGIETNPLSDKEVENFNAALNNLGETLSDISDDEFNNLDIKQEYSKDDFILDTLKKVKNLSPEETQKVFDYFGFELHPNKENKTGYSITGYPVNLNNGKKLAQITDPETKAVVEDLRENVIRFSENNTISCNDNKAEQYLNEVVSALPELRPMIGRTQSSSHDFDVMQHSLKVMREIVKNPDFEKLNDSDKKIMLLASLLHDITKKEGLVDKTHEEEGSFDSFFITKKFNLSQEEEIKLHTLIKTHEWLGRVNKSKNEKELTKNIQSTAYDLRHDNIFDMSLIFTHADLKAVRKDGSFHDSKTGKSRIDFNGEVRSFGESADFYAGKIKECINELKKSQPVLPVTKLPDASTIKNNISIVNPDGSTNIKGVYQDKDGLIVIKYNEVENWEELGLPKGNFSKGINITAPGGKKIDTGNIKFIAHGLDYPNQLAKFDAFSLIDSDALLSVSYMERPESKYRLFRPQGILLDVDTKYIHGGGESDGGSGFGKNIQIFKDKYIFDAPRENDRLFISNLIKKTAHMNDDEYIKFINENQNKSFNEIEPVELREKLIKAFALINSRSRQGERNYNEMYISNPKKPMAVFAYDMNPDSSIGNPLSFLNSTTPDNYNPNNKEPVVLRTQFLRQYALNNNLPFVLFGD